jgi:hypothetical protein
MAFKICPKCNEKCPARIRRCKKCDTVFAFKIKKNKIKSKTIENWRDLVVGDYIKVSGGPIWIGKDGLELPMGYSGIYAVVGLDKNGILACGKDKTGGFCHIWMEEEKSNDFGILKKPHKVSKINTK